MNPKTTQSATTNRPLNIGHAIDDQASRLDGVAKVTGKAKFSRDMYVDNQLFVGYVRCPWGAAKLKSTDQDAAKKIAGVVEVNIRGDAGKFHGHDVGYIVAESKHALRRALKALNAQWDRAKEIKTQITDSDPKPPEMKEGTAELLKTADHVLEAVYSTPVQTHSALETHGVMVDHTGDSAIVYASTQGTFSVRDEISESIGLPQSKFEVKCEYVGGGFGAKFGADKTGQTAAEVAAKYKRPVSVFCDREDEHLDTGNRPASRTFVKIGFKNDGTILGGQIATFGGVGVGRGGGANIPSKRYHLGDIDKQHQDISFNAGGPRAMRAPGHPQGAFAEELMLDEIATIAGIDPLELRKKIDAEAERREMYDLGSRLIGWSDRQKTGTQTGVIRRGFGMGSTSWPFFTGVADAEVVINRDGSVEVRTGTQDIGTGLRTIMGVLVADKLGVPLSIIDVRVGSSTLPLGPGSGGSTTSPTTSPAMMAAALDARDKFLKIIADRQGGDPSDYSIVNGEIRRKDEKLMAWKDACQKMSADSVTGKGHHDQQSKSPLIGSGHSHGAQFVDLNVDTETGLIHVKRIVAIQSCGRVICRKTAESQIIGGVIQGLSYGLFENKILDRQTGAMVNANLEMYKIAGTMDMPHIEPVLWNKGATGVRALGEPPTVPTAGAIACAVFNAIGSPVRHLPLTPDKVLAALDAAGKKGGAA